jgi:hypothetical protein
MLCVINPMSCDHCNHLTSGTPIRSPANLKRAIATAAEALNSCVLKYEGAGKWSEPFQDIAAGGPWGDFVSNYFSCGFCGQLFHLHAETYHGSGGAFEKTSAIQNPLQGAR